MTEVARVQSSRDEETWYSIDFEERTKKWTCNCADCRYREHHCKHIKALRAGVLGRGDFHLSEYGEKILPMYKTDKEYDL